MLVKREALANLNNQSNATLNTLNIFVKTTSLDNVGGLGRPGRNSTRARNHAKQVGVLGERIGGRSKRLKKSRGERICGVGLGVILKQGIEERTLLGVSRQVRAVKHRNIVNVNSADTDNGRGVDGCVDVVDQFINAEGRVRCRASESEQGHSF